MSKVQKPSLKSNGLIHTVDKDGFVIDISEDFVRDKTYYEYTKQKEKALNDAEKIIKSVLNKPYVGHVYYKDHPELYIGDVAYGGVVFDWADERAKYYYQRDMFTGNDEVGIEYVREIHFRNREYAGFSTLYSKTSTTNEVIATDEHLIRIIESNRKNKNVHNIIASIQNYQYSIISADKDLSMLVLGCAGSGKTMILMHRIRYLKYNYPDIDMSDFIVISPTDILGRESKELSEQLQVETAQQYDAAAFYESILLKYLKKNGIVHENFRVINEMNSSEEVYCEQELHRLCNAIKTLNKQENEEQNLFLIGQKNVIEKMQLEECSKLQRSPEETDQLFRLYKSSIVEMEQYSSKQIRIVIAKIERRIYECRKLERFIEFMNLLLRQKCFYSSSLSGDMNRFEEENDSSLDNMFSLTKGYFSLFSYSDIFRLMNDIDKVADGPVSTIQFLNMYIREQPDADTLYKLLDEWGSYSEESVIWFIKELRSQHAELLSLGRKRDMLKKLLLENRFDDFSTVEINLDEEKVLSDLFALYEQTENILVKNEGVTPIEFFAAYDRIVTRKECLKQKFENANADSIEYLYYIMIEKLGINNVNDNTREIPISKAFVMAEIFQRLFGSISNDRKFIFVDEFQDFSGYELLLLKKMYPEAVLNMYGDVNQCINAKGLQSVESIPDSLYNKMFVIKENYRNAKNITTFVTKILDIKMNPIGLSGTVKQINVFPEIEIENDDRVAVIVPDHYTYSELLIPSDYVINEYLETHTLKRGMLNLIPISCVKGLEFETAIVYSYGMTVNQQYVAYTRAISNLYVVPLKINDSGNDSTDENDFSGYSLQSYSGKIKKAAGGRNCQAITIPILQNGKEKSIAAHVDKMNKRILVSDCMFRKHQKGLQEWLNSMRQK